MGDTTVEDTIEHSASWDADSFQRNAHATSGSFANPIERLVFGAALASAEAGETLNIVVKVAFQGHELNDEKRLKILEECGDQLWGICDVLGTLGFTLSDCMTWNKNKLDKRYRKGHFTTEDSIARVDVNTPGTPVSSTLLSTSPAQQVVQAPTVNVQRYYFDEQEVTEDQFRTMVADAAVNGESRQITWNDNGVRASRSSEVSQTKIQLIEISGPCDFCKEAATQRVERESEDFSAFSLLCSTHYRLYRDGQIAFTADGHLFNINSPDTCVVARRVAHNMQ